jgi:hypothetical protein
MDLVRNDLDLSGREQYSGHVSLLAHRLRKLCDDPPQVTEAGLKQSVNITDLTRKHQKDGTEVPTRTRNN